MANLPRPSNGQIDAFVEHVASAHSWYKHLPLLPPGERFLFYLNPNAGREWIATEKGGAYRDRTPNTPDHERFHYTWQPTAEYLQRFGYLDYFAGAGTSFLVPVAGGVIDTQAVPRIQTPEGEWIDLPEDLRRAGEAHLTAAVHPLGQDPAIWLARLGKAELGFWEADTSLPDEVPNDDDLASIIEFVRRLPSPRQRNDQRLVDLPGWHALETDWIPAYARRLKEQMRRAIDSMLGCIYDSRSPSS